MAVYTDIDLKRFLESEQNVIIYPYDSSKITGVGYDLTIGFLKPISFETGFIEDENSYHILPSCHCVIITREFVWLSKKLIGTIHARGTLAALGLMTSATTVDPNFQGQMIMSIINVSKEKITIAKEETFCTLMLHEAKSRTRKLVGDDGTKNAMRILNKMYYFDRTQVSNETAEYKQRNLGDVVMYVNNESNTTGQVFLHKVVDAKQVINFMRLNKSLQILRKKFVLFVQYRVVAFFYMVTMGLTIYIVADIVLDQGIKDVTDKRLIVLLLIAILTAFQNFFKK